MIRLKIRDLGIYGEGIGSADGFTYFVPGALPGEVIDAEDLVVKKNYGKAELRRIVSPSADRVVPPCSVFHQCGGCQLMHLSYEKQLELKRKRVVDSLERIAKLSDVEVAPCTPSSQFGYRNKIQLPVSKGGFVGLYAARSHEIVPVSKCLIHSPLGEKILKDLKGVQGLRYVMIRSSLNTKEVLVTLISSGKPPRFVPKSPEIVGVVHLQNTEKDNVVMQGKETVLYGRNYINEILGEMRFQVSAKSFFQVNVCIAEKIIQKVMSHISSQEVVLDPFCGVGTFSLFAAKKVKKVIGMEINPIAIEDAKKNAEYNGIPNVDFNCCLAEEGLAKVAHADCIFLNPPRKGCHEKVIAESLRIKPQLILYMSCNPATLARDLALLWQGGYQLVDIQPYDMFPQTMHVETLVTLQSRDP